MQLLLVPSSHRSSGAVYTQKGPRLIFGPSCSGCIRIAAVALAVWLYGSTTDRDRLSSGGRVKGQQGFGLQ